MENSGRRPDIYTTAALYAADLILAERYRKKHILTQKLRGKILNMGDYSFREHYCLFLKEYVIQRITGIEPMITQFCNH